MHWNPDWAIFVEPNCCLKAELKKIKLVPNESSKTTHQVCQDKLQYQSDNYMKNIYNWLVNWQLWKLWNVSNYRSFLQIILLIYSQIMIIFNF